MPQFTPSKKTIKDFNDGEEYLNRIDVVQADTINNLVEGLLYAQEHGGGTTMLTEGREFGKTLNDNDYWLDVVGYGQSAYKIRADDGIKILSLSPVGEYTRVLSDETNGQPLIITDNEDVDMSLSVEIGEFLVLSNLESEGEIIIQDEEPSLCLTQDVDELVITENVNELKIENENNNQLKIGE